MFDRPRTQRQNQQKTSNSRSPLTRQPPSLGSQSERISHQLPQPGLRLHQSPNRLPRLPPNPPHLLVGAASRSEYRINSPNRAFACIKASTGCSGFPINSVSGRFNTCKRFGTDRRSAAFPEPSQQSSCPEFPGTNSPGHSQRKFPPSHSEGPFRHQPSGFPGTQPESAAVSDKPGGCQDRANRVNSLAAGDRPRPPQQPSFANRPTASGTNQIRFARTASCSLSRPQFSNGRQPFCQCRRRTRSPE